MRRAAKAAVAIAALVMAVVGLVAVARPGRPALDALDGPAVRIERYMASRSRPVALPLLDPHLLAGGPASRFYGVEGPAGSETTCAALAPVIQRRAGRYRLPRAGSPRELLLYLDSRERPTRGGSVFARSTTGPVAALRHGLRQAGPPLGPDELLDRCLEAARGDLPVGILACHNFLKDVTLEGRSAVPGAVPDEVGRIAARLRPWRRDPRTPAGEHDKLGPLYHLFATMTAGVWGGTPWLGRLVEWGEALRRTARLGRDRPDPEKAEADRCGANAAFLVWRLERPDRRYPFRRRRRRSPSSSVASSLQKAKRTRWRTRLPAANALTGIAATPTRSTSVRQKVSSSS